MKLYSNCNFSTSPYCEVQIYKHAARVPMFGRQSDTYPLLKFTTIVDSHNLTNKIYYP